MDISDKSLEELQQLETEAVARFDAADEADDLDAMEAASAELDEIRAAIEAAGGGKPDEPAKDEVPVEAVAASAEAPAEEPAKDAVTADGEAAVLDAPVAEPEAEAVVETPVETAEVETPVEEAVVETPSEDTPVETETPVEATAETTETEEPTSEVETAPEEADPTDPTDAASEETPTDAPAEVTNHQDEEETTVDIPEDRQPEVAEESVASTITAGAQLSSVALGDEFKDRTQLNEAFANRINSLRNARGGGEDRYTIATITASGVSEDRELKAGDPDGNYAKIQKITEPSVITASGGYCAPLETRYDIFGAGVTDRPVRDALAGFRAVRGGIRYTEAPKIADYGDSLGLWTAANDENPAVDEDDVVIPKPCLKVECAPEETAELDAVTLCLEFGNLMTRAYPELVDRHNQLALVAHARYAENQLLTKISALSTALTSGFKLGTARDYLAALSRAATAYRWRYRMNPTDALRVIAPYWVRDAMRLDLAFQIPGDNALEEADAHINGFLNTIHVNVSWHLDGPGFSPEVAASTLDDFPANFKWNIFAEGSLLFLDGGTLDIGVVRDSDLVGTNDYKTFTESFEGVAKIGGDVLEITTTTHVAGGTSGSVAVS